MKIFSSKFFQIYFLIVFNSLLYLNFENLLWHIQIFFLVRLYTTCGTFKLDFLDILEELFGIKMVHPVI